MNRHLFPLVSITLLLAGCGRSDYVAAEKKGSIDAYRLYLEGHPNALYYSAQARKRLHELEYEKAAKLGSVLGCERFLQRYPDSFHRVDVLRQIEELKGKACLPNQVWAGHPPFFKYPMLYGAVRKDPITGNIVRTGSGLGGVMWTQTSTDEMLLAVYFNRIWFGKRKDYDGDFSDGNLRVYPVEAHPAKGITPERGVVQISWDGYRLEYSKRSDGEYSLMVHGIVPVGSANEERSPSFVLEKCDLKVAPKH